MDRDKRWERVQIALKGLVTGEGESTEDPVAKIEERYCQGETDEFLKPIIVNGNEARLKGKTSLLIIYTPDANIYR
jgi:2,3-bisphosphoglycerate-independent phosphoglycerate mutase